MRLVAMNCKPGVTDRARVRRTNSSGVVDGRNTSSGPTGRFPFCYSHRVCLVTAAVKVPSFPLSAPLASPNSYLRHPPP